MHKWVLAALIVGSACKPSDTEKAATKGDPGPADVTGAQTAQAKPDTSSRFVAPKPLRFKVDEVHVEVPAMGEDFALLDVKELPPITDWKTIIVRSVDGREFTGTKPLLLTGTRTMRVVTLASGVWEFRVMEEVPSEGDAAPKPPRIRHKMTNAKSVIIYTKSYEPPPPSEPVTELTLTSKAQDVILNKAAMDAVDRMPEPGQREGRDTWSLATLLAAAKLKAGGGIRFTDKAGKTLELTSEELADKGKAHIIKRNRRGLFNYRHWTLGPPPKRVDGLRGVVSIELL